jgi:tripartite-type tricarboxylate transporter receptor subunit TctC
MEVTMDCVRSSRHLVALMLAAAMAFASVPAIGQGYPSQPIRILVTASPGGIGDVLARIFAQKLGATANATVVVENRTTGAGVVATDAVAKATPDGYLLLMGTQGSIAVRPHLVKVPYDVEKDFAPVILLVTVPNILVVHPSVPANSVKELVAYARANPGKLTYASQGVGSSGHIAGELFKQATGLDIVHVPYKGAAPAAQDLAAGHVHIMFDVVSLALAPVKAGRIRALGVAGATRASVLPEVPTMTEQGISMEVGAWFGLLAPAATPPQTVAWLNREANKAFSTPDAQAKFVAQGAVMPLGTPGNFQQFIAKSSKQFGDVIRAAGIKVK